MFWDDRLGGKEQVEREQRGDIKTEDSECSKLFRELGGDEIEAPAELLASDRRKLTNQTDLGLNPSPNSR